MCSRIQYTSCACGTNVAYTYMCVYIAKFQLCYRDVTCSVLIAFNVSVISLI